MYQRRMDRAQSRLLYLLYAAPSLAVEGPGRTRWITPTVEREYLRSGRDSYTQGHDQGPVAVFLVLARGTSSPNDPGERVSANGARYLSICWRAFRTR